MKKELTALQKIKRRQRIDKLKRAPRVIAGGIVYIAAMITVLSVMIIIAKIVTEYTVFLWELLP